MLRHALRRCAVLRGPAIATRLTASTAVRSIPSQPTWSSIAPNLSLYSRLYSSTTTATAAEDSPNSQSREQPNLVEEEITRFEDLSKLGVHDKIIKPITRGMGYETMTPVQSKTINAALQGKDMVAQAKTGTGKTLAFLIPIMQRMIQEDPRLAYTAESAYARSDDIRALILSPTRELAEQIAKEAAKLAKGTGLVVQLAVGGTQKGEMLRRTRREGCHLLVGTPGRVNDLLGDPSSGIKAPNLDAFVLDEADRMLDVGFADELDSIMRFLPNTREKVRQTMLFSATIPHEVISLARNMVRRDQFKFVQTIDPNDVPTHENIPQRVVTTEGMHQLLPALFELMDREISARQRSQPPFKAMIFCSTTAMTDMVGQLAKSWLEQTDRSRIPIYVTHGKHTQSHRSRVTSSFRTAGSAVLFTSDVSARGLDFPNVTHVIQIGSPESRDQYIHRVGRTGRAGKDGEGWLFLTPSHVGAARQALSELPLKADSSLESLQYKGSSHTPEAPAIFREVGSAYQSLPEHVLKEAYYSLFGKIIGSKQMLGRELMDWTQFGWGYPDPPAVPYNIAFRRGILDVPGINIVRPGDRRDAPRRSSTGEDGFGDTFDSQMRGAKDDEPSDRGSRGFGSRGGFGNNRRQGSRPSDFSSRNGGFGGFGGRNQRSRY